MSDQGDQVSVDPQEWADYTLRQAEEQAFPDERPLKFLPVTELPPFHPEYAADDQSEPDDLRSEPSHDDYSDSDSDESEPSRSGTALDPDDPDPSLIPGGLDQVIYRFQEDFYVTSQLLNRNHRKVYTAIRLSDEKRVVIVLAKTRRPPRASDPIPREIRLLARVGSHPHVAELLGWCVLEDNSDVYAILMPFYPNADAVVCLRGDLYLTAQYIRQVLQGLQHLKRVGVVHRDIATYNVMWDPLEERAVIIDLETGCYVRPQGYGREVGRDNYDAPEKALCLVERAKIRDERRDHPEYAVAPRFPLYDDRADLYSVGVILWMLLHENRHSPTPERLAKWVDKAKQRRKDKKFTEVDLLLRLLIRNPNLRITLEDALAHPFLTTTTPSRNYHTYRYHLDLMKEAVPPEQESSDHSGPDDPDDEDDARPREEPDRPETARAPEAPPTEAKDDAGPPPVPQTAAEAAAISSTPHPERSLF